MKKFFLAAAVAALMFSSALSPQIAAADTSVRSDLVFKAKPYHSQQELMSREHSMFKRTSWVGPDGLLWSNMCQTPTFWCTPGGVGHVGQPCSCPSAYGPVWGTVQ